MYNEATSTDRLIDQIKQRMSAIENERIDIDDALRKKVADLPHIKKAINNFLDVQNAELFSYIAKSNNIGNIPSISDFLFFPFKVFIFIWNKITNKLLALFISLIYLSVIFSIIKISKHIASFFATKGNFIPSGGWWLFGGIIGGALLFLIIPLIVRLNYIHKLSDLCQELLEKTKGLKHITLIRINQDGSVLGLTEKSDVDKPAFKWEIENDIADIISTKCFNSQAIIWDHKDKNGYHIFAIATLLSDTVKLVWMDSEFDEIKDDFASSIDEIPLSQTQEMIKAFEILEVTNQYFQLKREYFRLKDQLVILSANRQIWDIIAVNSQTRDELISRLGMFIAGDKAANKAIFLAGPIGSGREYLCSALATSVDFKFASLEDNVFTDIDSLKNAWEEIRNENKAIVYIENAERLFNIESEKNKDFTTLFNAWTTLLAIDKERERKIWIILGCQNSGNIIPELHRIMNASTVEVKPLEEKDCQLLLKQIACEIHFDYEIPPKIYETMTGSYVSDCIKLLNIMKQNTIMGNQPDKYMWKEAIKEVRKGHFYTYQEAMDAINSMVGLKAVKDQIQNLTNQAKLLSSRGRGRKLNESAHHMVFIGNPGTGKTTVARYIAAILYHLGIIKTPKFVECSDKNELVSSYANETTKMTNAVIDKALDGVLFIDEAYQLIGPDPQNPDKGGMEAIQALMTAMENKRQRLVVIVAGYAKEMQMNFMNANPGLESRFAYTFDFEDYKPDELEAIFDNMLKEESLTMNEDAKKRVNAYFKVLYANRSEHFGNAREVRKFFEKVISAQDNRLIAENDMSEESASIIKLDDIEKATDDGMADEKTLEIAMAELNGLLGLQNVKKQVAKMVNLAKHRQNQLKEGKVPANVSWNMEFIGNPGTGKTTVARIMGKIFKALGLLKKGDVLEVSRTDLVGEYVGQTGPKTQAVIKRALDSILFIDEAYMLARDAWGKEAFETVMKAMEDNKNRLVVITAGYAEDMKELRKVNAGVESRFPYKIIFEDYKTEELLTIFKNNIQKLDNLTLEPDAEKYIVNYFNKERKKEAFGNARVVRNLAESAQVAVAEIVGDDGNTPTVIDVKVAQKITGVADSESLANELNEALAELDKLEGIPSIKELVEELKNTAEFLQVQKEKGIEVEPPNLHMIFSGPPGTGKTTVARLMGKLLKGLGLLSRGHLVEADREKIVASGNPAANVKSLVNKALDGVLFIDEAYTLAGKDMDGGDALGKEAIDTLLKLMEDNRERLVVIAAGYTNEMRRFLDANTGLKSRFKKTISFENYSSEVLLNIYKTRLNTQGLTIDVEAEPIIRRYFDRLKQLEKEMFGNARKAREVAEDTQMFYQKERKKGRPDFLEGHIDVTLAKLITGMSEPTEEDLNKALSDLDKLIGLKVVKEKIKSMVDYAKFIRSQREEGGNPTPPSLHMVFSGAPGTGKTTVARLMGRIYKAMGLLPSDKLVETSRSDLVAGYTGQTAIKTTDVVKSALGGVLFIDEAYQLAGSDPMHQADPFGQEAIDTLLKLMEDNRDNLMVIVAGYSTEMRRFIESNTGLKSRFTNTIHFENYTPDELLQVFNLYAHNEQMTVTEEAQGAILKYFKKIASPKNEQFGNARDARNLYGSIIEAHAMHFKDPNYNQKVISMEDVRALTGERSQEAMDRELDEALGTLNKLVGLAEVKSAVNDFVRLAKYNLEQEKNGNKVAQPSYHMVFAGAPGTGKTTVARLMGKIFKALGVLKTDKLVETSRTDLVAGFSGQTAIKTTDVVKSAMDGVLFIDEAYQLAGADSTQQADSFGQEAIDTLLKLMEDHRDRLVVIAAGYSDQMRRFIESNPGLSSRFQRTIHFANYSPEELLEVLKLNAQTEGKRLSDECIDGALKHFKRIARPKDELFGNAREARKLYDALKIQHSIRMDQPGFDINTFELCDLNNVIGDKSESQKNKELDEAMAELNAMVGLGNVKETIKKIVYSLRHIQELEAKGKKVQASSRHMVFSGAPGTGKTTVARLMGRIFKALGCLSKGTVVEVGRADLIGRYQGHTALQVKDKVKSAMDGILFIDEAYTLVQDDEHDMFGHEAIDTLLKEMEDNRDRLVVIVAGYTQEMKRFMASNPGLASRFTQYVQFDNYTVDELISILNKRAQSEDLSISDDALIQAREYFTRVARPENVNFGNARDVRNLFDELTPLYGMRETQDGIITANEMKSAIESLEKRFN